MVSSLLVTKLYFPSTRPALVPRPRLVGRLSSGLCGPLTLIAAPAGYGKTTLFGEWRAGPGAEAAVAWLSLDGGDNNRVRFFLYLTAAFETIQTSLIQNTTALLQSPQIPPSENIATTLLNELSQFGGDLILVLDDYQVITNPEIHAALTFLLDHLPPYLHIAILTRADPQLPLARLRARGQLVEIRAADLRFNQHEAAAFLNEIMGLKLSTYEVSALEARTEGWIAGLQLAALSMQGREDVEGFITAFSGSHQFVVDYLAEEVLERQTAEVRDFLLKTSILERLCGPLCDVLTGLEGGQATLERLAASNLFLIPLDDERRWFRYHHLFADLLRNRLKSLLGDQAPDLLSQASDWCAQQSLIDEAITYALQAKDIDRAADLIEQFAGIVIEQGKAETMTRWISALPEEIIIKRPRLGLSLAWSIYSDYKFDQSESLVSKIEQKIRPDERPVYHGELALWHGIIARRHCQPEQSLYFLREALEHLPVQQAFFRGRAWLFLGLAYLESDVIKACEAFQQAVHIFESTGELHLAIPALHRLAWAKMLRGSLTEAGWAVHRALEISEQFPQWPVAGYAHFAAAELYCERNDLVPAKFHAERATELARLAGNSDNLLIAALNSARIARTSGDFETAQILISKVYELAQPTIPWMKVQVVDEQISLYLAQGKLNQAILWFGRNQTPPQLRSAVPWLHEQIIEARLQVALREGKSMLPQLSELLEKAQTLQLSRWVIQLYTLQALAHLFNKEKDSAFNKFKSALELAAPENAIQVFLDLGQPLIELLQLAQKARLAPEFVVRVASAFERQSSQKIKSSVAENQTLRVPLSQRELELLALVAAGRTNKEIASELVIAIGTVKRHTVNIFNKLEVKNRTEAVAKARELELL